MTPKLPPSYKLSREVAQARQMDLPILALETALVTHGLPRPENLGVVEDMETEVRSQGVVPATIGVLDGRILVGMSRAQLGNLAEAKNKRKISSRDYAGALSKGESGGTTVAGTMVAAHTAGIRVFATGGIGGVHRGTSFDRSADLEALARYPLVVVCAGAKAILDLPATLEVLESLGIPVVGFQTDEFPAFYTRTSGLPVSTRADTPGDVAEIARAHWDLGLKTAVLVAVPVPEGAALPSERMEKAIQTALRAAEEEKVRGPNATPFLLKKVSQLTGRRSLRANLALLTQNARIGAQIARRLTQSKRFRQI